MTVGLSLSEREQDSQRMELLGAFSPEQLATGLVWLSGYDPRTFDAVLNAAEPCRGDDLDGGDEPEPVCGRCGEKIGIFLRLGLDWRHYREPPGHQPRRDRVGADRAVRPRACPSGDLAPAR
jgi:hypothetical protein